MRLLEERGDELIIAVTVDDLVAIESAVCAAAFLETGGGEEAAVYDAMLDIMRQLGR
jgi:hypothetical protein